MAIPRQPADINAVVGVVDDDKRIRQALVRALQSENYGVLTAANGLQAIKIADEVDIMVLDLTMPHLGGLEV
ncbi:MAG: response regulator, partial [Acidimicrobiales bacterium]|nr:response regulator [Acidimicrobiales bacterium]